MIRDAGEASHRPLPSGAVVLVAAVIVLLAAGQVVDRWPIGIDRALVVALRYWGDAAGLREAAIQITALGSVPVLVLVVIAAAGALLAARHALVALAMVAGTATGGLAVTLLKIEVARPRPEIVPHLVVANGLSFPSGHAAGSAIVYLTLAALGSRIVRRPAVGHYLLAVAIVLVAAIGASRVYLGVHWPSDVVAGWCFGTLWAWGCWRATAGLRRELG